jgi:hypothetical protein
VVRPPCVTLAPDLTSRVTPTFIRDVPSIESLFPKPTPVEPVFVRPSPSKKIIPIRRPSRTSSSDDYELSERSYSQFESTYAIYRQGIACSFRNLIRRQQARRSLQSEKQDRMTQLWGDGGVASRADVMEQDVEFLANKAENDSVVGIMLVRQSPVASDPADFPLMFNLA